MPDIYRVVVLPGDYCGIEVGLEKKEILESTQQILPSCGI